MKIINHKKTNSRYSKHFDSRWIVEYSIERHIIMYYNEISKFKIERIETTLHHRILEDMNNMLEEKKIRKFVLSFLRLLLGINK